MERAIRGCTTVTSVNALAVANKIGMNKDAIIAARRFARGAAAGDAEKEWQLDRFVARFSDPPLRSWALPRKLS